MSYKIMHRDKAITLHGSSADGTSDLARKGRQLLERFPTLA